MADLKLKDVGKTYGGSVEVLKDINLEIETGELIVFVGPSGCGKSTLLRMIAGLEKISAGTLEIDGLMVNDVPPAQRGIAMVFQSYALYPHMTVRDNMSFSLKIAKKSKEEIEAAVARAAKILQLEPYLDRLPKALSGGQRQRVAIGRAIVRDPKVYLFDEPLSNLDAALRVATRIEIAQLKESMPDSTMIYVTHDQVEAMTLATRIVVLANKGISQVGTPLELYEKPENEFVAQFIGSPSMNLLPGTITGTGAQTTIKLDGEGTAVSNIPTTDADMGKTVNVGIRPEDLTIAEGDQYAVDGNVDIVEALGEVTLLYFVAEREQDPLVAKLPGIHADQRGRNLRLTADPSKVHVFMDGKSLLYR
ncbi:ABC transporter ATP-binding protein [Psychromarinibacter halotolerans]|uniref:ABC transporter ATP-binding protein n=1 Tax=Psychromarinibacter halotolerans TaxID=1775175 RepID=A0ABV7GX31_9RHOB|nr:sn-glycerol-3-phosphate ABC transporter ATP-binding protein UgpC [Psychromarinibacter halotolerans]MDF0594763.1 sn-glycerol-3-phosphate ABC transporter ATP-binding protein UgpC [Psychromarinibacter halotolerans]